MLYVFPFARLQGCLQDILGAGIALDLERCLQGAGAYVLCASTLGAALRFMDRPGLSAAVLDYSLTDGDCRPVSARLMTRGIPLVIFSGYPDLHELFPGANIVPKPADLQRVVEAVCVLLSSPSAILPGHALQPPNLDHGHAG